MADLVSGQELIDIVIMVFGVGFIFSNFIRLPEMPKKHYDPLEALEHRKLNDLWIAIMISAPAVVFHELAHKAVAIAQGLHATFHASYLWLGIGALLSALKFPFIFFVPGFVAISGPGSPLNYGLAALAGPMLNLVLWVTAWSLLKLNVVARRYVPIVGMTSQINMFLFIFNMLPIPGFDGFSFYRDMWLYFMH